MDYLKATDKQLWNIMKYDKECPLRLMEGVFQESVKRGLIKSAIIQVIKRKKIGYVTNNEFNVTFDDFIQIGYEGALTAIKDYEPGRGYFINFLYNNISHTIGLFFQKQKTQKRKGDVVSYQNTFSADEMIDSYETFLIDYKASVEKIVMDKMALEEKLSVLTMEQRRIFDLFFVGYTLKEIKAMTNFSFRRVQGGLQGAFINMTGQKLDLRKIGVCERASRKKQGA
jgi:RNA polymerase sigma factor (sigma-70 family)